MYRRYLERGNGYINEPKVVVKDKKGKEHMYVGYRPPVTHGVSGTIPVSKSEIHYMGEDDDMYWTSGIFSLSEIVCLESTLVKLQEAIFKRSARLEYKSGRFNIVVENNHGGLIGILDQNNDKIDCFDSCWLPGLIKVLQETIKKLK